MQTFIFRNFKIQISVDQSSEVKSTGYNFIYGEDRFRSHSKTLVKSTKDESSEEHTALIMGSGGATGIHSNSGVLNEDHLLICVSDHI